MLAHSAAARQATAIGELLTDMCSSTPGAIESPDSVKDQLATLCAALSKDVGSDVHVRTLHALIAAPRESHPPPGILPPLHGREE